MGFVTLNRFRMWRCSPRVCGQPRDSPTSFRRTTRTGAKRYDKTLRRGDDVKTVVENVVWE